MNQNEVGVSVNDDARAALELIVANSIVMGRHPTATYESVWRAACAFTYEEAAKICEDERDTEGKDFGDVWSHKDAYVDACNDCAIALRERAKWAA